MRDRTVPPDTNAEAGAGGSVSVETTEASRLRAVLRWLRTQSQALLECGFGLILVPALIGYASGQAILEFWPKPDKSLGTSGQVGVVLGSVIVGNLLWWLGAFVKRDDAGRWAFRAVSLWIWRRLAIIGAFVLLLELSHGIEKRHPFLVIIYSLLCGLLCLSWMYHARLPASWAGHWQRFLASRWAGLSCRGVLVALFATYSLVIARLSILNHLSFNTRIADLGIYVNVFRRSSLGDPLGMTLAASGNHLGGHFDPILVLLAPLYLIYPEAETLLVLEAVWVASGVFPLYLLAQHYTGRRDVGLVLAAAYAVYPGLHGVNLFDFHSLTLIIPIVFWVILAFERRWLKAFSLLFVLMLSVREDAALIGASLGLAFLFSKQRHALVVGLPTLLVSLLYFYVVRYHVMPVADLLNQSKGNKGYAYYYKELIPKSDPGGSGVLATLLTDPFAALGIVFRERKFLYFLQTMVPVLFLPFFAKRGKLLLIYPLAFLLLASREHVASLHFHYTGILVPFVFVLAAAGYQRVLEFVPTVRPVLDTRRLMRGLLTATLVVSLLLSWKFGGAVSNKSFRAGFRPLDRTPSQAQLERAAFLKSICRQLPKDARILAPSTYIPHLGRCHHVLRYSRRKDATHVVWLRPSKGRGGVYHRMVKRKLAAKQLELVRALDRLELYRVSRPKSSKRAKKP